MESNEQLDLLAEDDAGLVIDANETGTLTDAIKWGRFFVIGTWITSAIFVLLLLVIWLTEYRYLQGISQASGSALLLWGCYVIMAIVMLVFLLRFCIFCRRAIDNEDLETFNEALQALKIYFIISGTAGMLYLLFTLMQYAKAI